MKWLILIPLGLTIWSGSCRRKETPPGPVVGLDTALFARPQPIGIIRDPTLAEVSGLAPGIRNPGYLWTEEDSGNPNQIQLITPTGTVVGRFLLPALVNHDWEDIATATNPHTGQACIYLAEIGDNAARPISRLFYRIMHWPATKVIYRFAEPALAGRKLPVTEAILVVDTLALTLPYGPRDSEAILVEPATNDIYVLTKGPDCEVYRARYPQSRTTPTPMQHLLTLPFSKVTSATLSPDGREILIRTYKELFYYERQPGESIPDALKRPARPIPLAFEPQGEAIGWRLDGTGYYTTTELLNDTPQVISFYPRRGGAALGDSLTHN